LHIQSTFETLNENNALLHQNLSYPRFGKFGALAQSELFPMPIKNAIDSVFKTLTVDQKIGQLMMPRANYNATYDTTRLNQIVRDYHVGGLVFAGNPSKQAVLVNKLQAIAKVPMLIGMDLEWGLSMRLDSTTFPLSNGAWCNARQYPLLEEMGYQIALQCKRIGVHVNYAPVVDINNN
jgi:beta-glucosidase-like glycosyl hydrolase